MHRIHLVRLLFILCPGPLLFLVFAGGFEITHLFPPAHCPVPHYTTPALWFLGVPWSTSQAQRWGAQEQLLCSRGLLQCPMKSIPILSSLSLNSGWNTEKFCSLLSCLEAVMLPKCQEPLLKRLVLVKLQAYSEPQWSCCQGLMFSVSWLSKWYNAGVSEFCGCCPFSIFPVEKRLMPWKQLNMQQHRAFPSCSVEAGL